MSIQPTYLLSTGLVPDEMIKEAAVRNILLDMLSFITVEQVADEAVRQLAVQPLTAVFTSVNALEAVKTGLQGRVPDWKIFCLGGATRQAVTGLFGEPAIAGTAETAGALAGVIFREGWARRSGREIFFFCGDHRREELPSVLRSAGFTVNERVVYRTRLTPHKTERMYAGIAFFSPSGVESYFSVNAIKETTTLFAIGHSTAAAIKARCCNPMIIGEQPDKGALIRKMIEYFSSKR